VNRQRWILVKARGDKEEEKKSKDEVTGAFGAVILNHIHTAQTEEMCGGEKLAVVGIDFSETILRSTGEM